MGDDATRLPPAVLAHLRTHLDAAVDEVVEALREELPEYADLMADDRRTDDLRGAVRAVATWLLDALEAGRDLSGDELAEAEALGARRAAGGFSLEAVSDAVLLAVSIGQRRLFDAWHALPSPPDDPEALRDAVGELSRLGRALVRAYQSGVMRGQAERFHEQVSRTHRARDEFLRRVLESHVTDEAPVLRRAGALDLREFAPPFALVVVRQHPARPDASLYDKAAACARQLPVRALQPVPYEDDPDYPAFAVLVVPGWRDAHLRDLRNALGDAGRRIGLVSVYDVAPRVEDVRRVFLGLRSSVPVMDSCAGLVGHVTEVDTLLPYLMVSHLAENRQAALLDLTADRSPRGTAPAVTGDHLLTLRASLDTLAPNHSEVARRRELHRDTVKDHLEAIEEATGRGVADDHMLFAASFYLRDLLAGEPPTPG